MVKFSSPSLEMLSKMVLDVCPNESCCAQTYPGAPKCSLPYSDTPYLSPTFPIHFQHTLFNLGSLSAQPMLVASLFERS